MIWEGKVSPVTCSHVIHFLNSHRYTDCHTAELHFLTVGLNFSLQVDKNTWKTFKQITHGQKTACNDPKSLICDRHCLYVYTLVWQSSLWVTALLSWPCSIVHINVPFLTVKRDCYFTGSELSTTMSILLRTLPTLLCPSSLHCAENSTKEELSSYKPWREDHMTLQIVFKKNWEKNSYFWYVLNILDLKFMKFT